MHIHVSRGAAGECAKHSVSSHSILFRKWSKSNKYLGFLE